MLEVFGVRDKGQLRGLVGRVWFVLPSPSSGQGLSTFTGGTPLTISFSVSTTPLVTAGVSLLIAVPLGIGAAIFLAELAPARVSDTLQFFIDLLAAVPSVIYGLLGVFVVIPLMREYIQPGLIIGLPSTVPGPGVRRRFSQRRNRVGHHGHPVHYFRLA